MFRSQTMRKVELFVPERDVVGVTEALATSGAFHLTKPDYVGGDSEPEQPDEWQELTLSFAALEQRILALMRAIGVQEDVLPSKALHLILPALAERDITRLEEEIGGPVRELEQARQKLVQFQRYLSQLEPIANLDIDLNELRNLHYTFMIFGTIPTVNIERLKTSLEHFPNTLVVLYREPTLATVVLVGLQRDAEILAHAARSAYLNAVDLPPLYRGTPTEVIATIHASIKRTHEHIVECEREIAHLHHAKMRHLQYLLWRVRASRTLAETVSSFGRLRDAYLIAGWVPTTQVQRIKDGIVQISAQTMIEVTTPRPEELADMPVLLNNPGPIKVFEALVANYSAPRYDELDPTPLLAVTFPLFFGLMFGDVGHGLFLSLFGVLLLSRMVPRLRAMAGFGGILAACGLTSSIFGFLYGSVFGFEDVLTALWLRPLEAITDILIVSVGIGVIVLSLGMLYHIVNCALMRRWAEMIFSRNGVAGLVLYWSLLGVGAGLAGVDLPLPTGVFIALALVAALAVAFAEWFIQALERQKPRFAEGLAMGVMLAFFEVFETLISMFSNTLSYVRMGAFAVAHGALSLVVFILAEMVSPAKGWGYWLTVALGNLFVIGFEGVIVGIQTMRLEYYELFSKFYSGGGRSYHPLTLIHHMPENS